jgi:15-cis-phytoene synthase
MSNLAITDIETEEFVLPNSGKTSFYYSFSFLPKDERDAIHTVYAFCRQIDDIVDDSPSEKAEEILKKRERLQRWRVEIEKLYNNTSTITYLKPLGLVVRKFGIPKQYLLTIIDGCERDLTQRRYQTFDELKDYCYSVASIVGLMSIEIFGYKYDETKEYATNLGYALQLTNIIRDVKCDKDRGYIYLPKEDMQKFRYTEEDLMNEVYDERFIALMDYQSQRARHYYNKARAMLRPDERTTMFAAEIMDAIYYRLLEKIELRNYNVFERKVSVSTIHKVWIALKLWLYTKIMVRRS